MTLTLHQAPFDQRHRSETLTKFSIMQFSPLQPVQANLSFCWVYMSERGIFFFFLSRLLLLCVVLAQLTGIIFPTM